jgi:hypothetical protein
VTAPPVVAAPEETAKVSCARAQPYTASKTTAALSQAWDAGFPNKSDSFVVIFDAVLTIRISQIGAIYVQC